MKKKLKNARFACVANCHFSPGFFVNNFIKFIIDVPKVHSWPQLPPTPLSPLLWWNKIQFFFLTFNFPFGSQNSENLMIKNKHKIPFWPQNFHDFFLLNSSTNKANKRVNNKKKTTSYKQLVNWVPIKKS